MMHDGACFSLALSVAHTHVKECSSFATPGHWDGVKSAEFTIQQIKKHQDAQTHASKMLYEALLMGISIQDCPAVYELAMLWPVGWTGLKPLETAKFRQWLNLHGKHWEESK